MRIPIGILAYSVKHLSDQQTELCGFWYFNDTYVPSTVEEKKGSILAFNQKRCAFITLKGTFIQISDIIAHSDRFDEDGSNAVPEYLQLLKDIEITPINEPYLFDDIDNVQGTALMIYTTIEADVTFDEIMESVNKDNAVEMNISERWSYGGDVMKAIN